MDIKTQFTKNVSPKFADIEKKRNELSVSLNPPENGCSQRNSDMRKITSSDGTIDTNADLIENTMQTTESRIS